MLKKSFSLLPLIFGGAALLGGTWFSSLPAVPQSHPTPVVAQVPSSGMEEKEAGRLFDSALANLSTDRVSWLKTHIHQKMTDTGSTFNVSGVLQRGPNHCARLELEVVTAGVSSKLLVVSDGEVLAQERTIPDTSPTIVCERLPGESAGADNKDAPAREAYLACKGCGGPLALLTQMRPHLKNLRSKQAVLQNAEVVELKADWQGEGLPNFAITTLQICQAVVFLDAKTLWPRRVELWGSEGCSSPCCLVEVEFRDPCINQELSLPECERVFSYQPGGAPAVAPQ